jgi:hypothetical protein
MADDKTFTCACCGQTYRSLPESVAKAEAEAAQVWGVAQASTDAQMVVLCDDCYRVRPPEEGAAMGQEFQHLQAAFLALVQDRLLYGWLPPGVRPQQDALKQQLLEAPGLDAALASLGITPVVGPEWWGARRPDPLRSYTLMASKEAALLEALREALVAAGVLEGHRVPDGWWARRADDPQPPSGTSRTVDLQVRREQETRDG